MHKVEVTKEDFAVLLKQFTGASGWRRSNGKGSFNLNQEQDEDKRRKLKYGDIVFIEKVDTDQ